MPEQPPLDPLRAAVLEARTEAQSPFLPQMPRTIEQLGVPKSLVIDIALRRINTEGASTITSLSRVLKLSVAAATDIFEYLRQQHLVDVKGMIGEDYSFSLTSSGRQLALDRFQVCQYCGPIPVSLQHYDEAVRRQSARLKVTCRSLRAALSDLVLSDALLAQLGPAVISQRSLFLYGPTGNGKTSIAERLTRLYSDAVAIPHAIEVDGQIIVLFDPITHDQVEIETPFDFDCRWLFCRRPRVIVGGELVNTMLDLRFDEASRTYAAPVQLKANNGIFIVDDFGRQLVSPRELLNRWIIPLDRRVDYLNLRYGLKFQIPFEVMVVFATNLNPHELADDAFLRRIHSKVYVEAVTPEVFDVIFDRVTATRKLPCSPGTAAVVRQLCLESGCTELRACYPNDICDLLEWINEYEEAPRKVDLERFRRAVRLHFA